MGRGKIAVLLFTILVLSLSVVASCAGVTSQGPEEQRRPAESQSSTREGSAPEPVLKTPEKSMEETAREEQTEQPK